MTTITDTFFAPMRDMEVRNTTKKTAWKSLFVSSSVHVLGFILVIMLSQYSLEQKRVHVREQSDVAPINASLYVPKKITLPLETKLEGKEASAMPMSLKTDATDESVPAVKEPTNLNFINEKQKPDTNTKPDDEPKATTPSAPQPETTSSNANQRAGQFNFSAKEAASHYFDAYNNEQLVQEAIDATRDHLNNKTSPTIVDPRKDSIEPDIPPRPVKRVDCTSSAAKTLAVLSGITGGTLQCTNLGDPKRFIEARVKKRPNEGR